MLKLISIAYVTILLLNQASSRWIGFKKQLNVQEEIGPRERIDEKEGAVRLVDGPNPWQGRLEYYHAGRFGTVCNEGWDVVDSQVVCRELGYYIGEPATPSVKGSGQIWMSYVQCKGPEIGLFKCAHTLHTEAGSGCRHTEDVGVSCVSLQADPNEDSEEGAVRLVNHNLESPYGGHEGRVEIYHDWEWGSVCDDDWTQEEARVICRQLGLTGGQPLTDNEFGAGMGSIWMDNVQCTEEESSLADCHSNGWGIHNCGHHEDAGVRCDPPA